MYGATIKEVYCEKIYPKAVMALFTLDKHEPLALPFYACLHAMTQQKRRVFDTPALKLRIADNKIHCYTKFDYMAKDYDRKSNYYSSMRRVQVSKHTSLSVGAHPIEFEEILNSITKAYPGAKVEPAVLDYAKRLDAYLNTTKKTEYESLEETFKETIGNMQAPMQTRVSNLKLENASFEVETHRSSLETSISDIREGSTFNFCNISTNFEFDPSGKDVVFGKTTIHLNEDSGQGETLKRIQDVLPQITKIAKEELNNHFVKTIKEYKETRDILNAVDEKLIEFSTEATKLYEQYYKTSIEELQSAQVLGKVTI